MEICMAKFAGMLTIGLGVMLAGAAAQAQQSPLKMTLFGQPAVNNDAIWMALEKGFYQQEGLDVTYRLFPSGTTAFQSFQTGQGDIVMTGDLPSVQYFFRVKGDYRTIAVIERDAKGYVAVAQKAITKPQDLVGKTIATRVGSTGSWFISEYLSKNGVDPSKVTVKNLDTQVLPAALCGGEIAAFFIWQPVGSRTLEICPDKAHYLTDASGYIQGYLVAGARPQWLASPQGKDIAMRWLRATIKGREVAEKDFAAVAAYAKAKLDLSEKAAREQWDTNLRPLAIDKVYYDDFCSLSRWAQKEKMTGQVIDFGQLTWPDGLRAIDPKRVDAVPPAPLRAQSRSAGSGEGWIGMGLDSCPGRMSFFGKHFPYSRNMR
jgi:ABC-type nitrate/sulfonate/bicarbonate transport system substrate-binding protein